MLQFLAIIVPYQLHECFHQYVNGDALVYSHRAFFLFMAPSGRLAAEKLTQVAGMSV